MGEGCFVSGGERDGMVWSLSMCLACLGGACTRMSMAGHERLGKCCLVNLRHLRNSCLGLGEVIGGLVVAQACVRWVSYLSRHSSGTVQEHEK